MIKRRPKSIITSICTIAALGLVLAGCASSGGAGAGSSKEDAGAIEQAMLKAAHEAQQRNNFDAAAGYYSRLLRLKPDDVEVAVLLGRNLRYSGNAKQAADVLSGLSKNNPDNTAIKLEHAKALIALGDFGSALSLLNEITISNGAGGNNWQAFSALGITYDSLGNYKMAEKSFSAALEISPNNPVIMNNMAMSLAQSGRIKEAISTLEKAAVLNRNSPHIRQNLALLYGISGDREKAKTLASMDLDPKEVETNASFYRRFEGGSR